MSNITLDDLMRSESEVLNDIAAELDVDGGQKPRGAHHMCHTSGHSSRGGHFSSTAKVERPLKKDNKK